MSQIPEIKQLQSAGAAFHKLAERERNLRQLHAEAVRLLAVALTAPPPADEVVANMRRIVDVIASDFAAEQGTSVLAAFGGELGELRADGSYRDGPPRLWQPPHGTLRITDLCGLFPELMKARFEQIIRGLNYEAGSPASQRAALRKKCEAQIRAIEEQHTELVDAAGALRPPVHFELLQSVKDQREAEASQRERDAARIQARRDREALLNTANR